MAFRKLVVLWVVLGLSHTAHAMVDVTIPYGELTYLPSSDQWVEYPAVGESCAHMASNSTGAAVEYTFTGTAIQFWIPKAGDGANVRITFSDGTEWFYNSNDPNGGCGFYGLTFPSGQYESLSVRLEPTGGQYLNIEKLVITQLTDAELQSLAAQSSAAAIDPISLQSVDSTQSVASLASLASLNSVASLSALSVAQETPTSIPVQTSQVQITTVIEVRTTVGISVETYSTTTVFPTGVVTGSPDVETSSKSSNTGPIVGGVIGGVLGLLIIGFLIFFLRRRRRNATAPESLDSNLAKPPPSQAPTSPPFRPASFVGYDSMQPMQQGYGEGPYSQPPSQMQSPFWNPNQMASPSPSTAGYSEYNVLRATSSGWTHFTNDGAYNPADVVQSPNQYARPEYSRPAGGSTSPRPLPVAPSAQSLINHHLHPQE